MTSLRRVCLVGVRGVGKTTLIRSLLPQLPHVDYIVGSAVLRELAGADFARFDHLPQGFLLEVSGTFDDIDEIRHQFGSTLILVFNLGPRGLHFFVLVDDEVEPAPGTQKHCKCYRNHFPESYWHAE